MCVCAYAWQPNLLFVFMNIQKGNNIQNGIAKTGVFAGQLHAHISVGSLLL